MEINKRLKLLRIEMQRHNIDAYIVPTCDFNGSEYIGDHFKTREYISGFDGSAGTAVITAKEALLWTDGRYFLQAQTQLEDSEFVLMKSGEPNVCGIREYLENNLQSGAIVGFDGRMISTAMAEEISDIKNIDIDSEVDLIGNIWTKRPSVPCTKIWDLPLEFSGETCGSKLKRIREEMTKRDVDFLLVTSLEEIAWTLNLRASDIECTPVFLAYMLIAGEECHLFIKKRNLDKVIIDKLQKNNVVLHEYDDIYNSLINIENRIVWLDRETTNYNIYKSVSEKNIVISEFTPIMFFKAVKNSTEIQNMYKAHLMDGVAMTKFIYWLKKNIDKIHITELSLGEKLEEFRSAAKAIVEPDDICQSYIGPSFAPIVGYKEHGAVVHYSATEETNYDIENESIVLIDSGGHYKEGTTDITRTISLGPVTEKMRQMYTTVLRGNLNLAAVVFKSGCSGCSLDYIARKPLWDKGLDYNHGTGHGVGYLLSVHEQPNGIRYKVLPNNQLNAEIKPGMITSDEPGIYLEGEFGIRIENLLLCIDKFSNSYGDFRGFDILTLVPFDKELINVDEMSDEEIATLTTYNKKVFELISPYLSKEESQWLKQECAM